jgi:UDP:flavonoid glycosyltransferase YjiC (YdhE family)
MLLVTGPRIDPRLLPDSEGMDKRGYVPDLFEHLACADAAVVQGGLSTTMELVATGRPFIYFPLRRHWEQQHFVTHRLAHYGAGIRMDFATTSADDLATAMRTALAQASSTLTYRDVPRGGAGRAAGLIAGLITG